MNRFLKKLARRRELERDLEDELRFHLEMRAAASSPSEARQLFGNLTAVKEVCRDMWSFTTLESWWTDVRYGIRSLASAPGFAMVAISALALGIGVNTAIFTIMDGALSWNLGLDHLERIVMIGASNTAAHSPGWAWSYPDFRDFRARAKSLDGLAAYQMTSSNVSDTTGPPERFWSVQISANGFRVAETKPMLGRDFVDGDERADATPVLMLSHRVWRQRYGEDPAILGKTVRVDDVPRVVVGVMPPDRRFPEETDLWTPLVPSEDRRDRRLMLVGRMPPGGRIAAVRAEMETVSVALAREYPDTNKDLAADVRPIAAITGVHKLRPVFEILFAAVGFVLLIACVDVANMLLARGAGRTREMSVRLAIGAGKFRIVRQLLIESVLLSAAGGLCGWGVAVFGLRWFDHSTAVLDKPVWLHLSLDRTAFVYLAAISIGTGILFGLAPALRLVQTSILGVLKDGGHGTVGTRATMRLSSTLVVFQMVLCILLLGGAGLMIRSANKLYAAPIGARTANVLTGRITLPLAKYRLASDRIEMHRRIREQLETLPGVDGEAIASRPPVGGWDMLEWQVQSETATQRVASVTVNGSYFRLFDIKTISGRSFSDGEPEVVVNGSLAARYWPGESALGKHLRIVGDGPRQQSWLTVVGVIPDVLQRVGDLLERRPLAYVPYSISPGAEMFLLLRTKVPPEALARNLRVEVQKLDRDLPVFETRPLEDRIHQGFLETTVFGAMGGVFAAVALVLATFGLYSVIAHSVSTRSQEIGLRMAMGSSEKEIMRLVFRQGMRPVLLGLVIGVPATLGAMMMMRAAFLGVGPGDPLTYGLIVVVLLIAGCLGCIVPAMRAARVDPVVALRCQ